MTRKSRPLSGGVLSARQFRYLNPCLLPFEATAPSLEAVNHGDLLYPETLFNTDPSVIQWPVLRHYQEVLFIRPLKVFFCQDCLGRR